LIELTERSTTAIARLSATTDTESIKKDLQLVLRLESAWSAHYDSLRKLPLHDVENDGVVGQLDEAVKNLFAVNGDISTARERFRLSLEDFPTLRNSLEALSASLRRMQRISDRVGMLENPHQFPEQSDLKHIRESSEEIAALRRDADSLVDTVLLHKKTIDDKLAQIIENYVPERIDPVDRAILRLAACELLTRPDISAKIVINEAIDLAKKFGSTDSGRFVNGVLDQIRKS
jgi:N utilization substance protein B